MKKIIVFVLLTSFWCFSQKTIPEVLKKYNKNSVNYITAKELQSLKNPILLDTRETNEYNVSHIDNAALVGFTNFDSKKIKEKYKNLSDTIVVYCSIGVRSEQIGEKLQKLGYKNVFNLYGGIFEWKNQNQTVVDDSNNPTEKVHAYSKEWSIYLNKGEKIYDKPKKSKPLKK